jgi:hypothetical protein
MNPRLELILITVVLWLAIVVVLLVAFSGCAVPLR